MPTNSNILTVQNPKNPEEKEILLGIVDTFRNELPPETKLRLTASAKEAEEVLTHPGPPISAMIVNVAPDEGAEMVTHLKKVYPAIPIMFLVNPGFGDYEERLKNAGADVYVEKPFDIEQIRDGINSLLGHRSSTP